ncbi:MAG: dephospho-CoA kinase, partial [Persicimonas sp.]
MGSEPDFYIVGLTGGIASGKSTVGQMFEELGVPVIDADQLARRVVAPGEPALDEIRQAFGDEVIDEDGRLDRSALGERIFGDDEARKKLEGITHPRIAQKMQERAEALRDEGHRWV